MEYDIVFIMYIYFVRLKRRTELCEFFFNKCTVESTENFHNKLIDIHISFIVRLPLPLKFLNLINLSV